jgi:hypothetical protein
VVIYGATVAGIGAAYTARLMGKKVLLIQHDWFGGMTGAGGLTNLDLYYPNVYGSLLSETSARESVKNLRNFRLVRVRQYRRIFNKVGIIFLQKYKIEKADLRIASCATRSDPDSDIICSGFECDENEF